MSRQSSFTDRTLVVSGGSRGIGLAVAPDAAKQGVPAATDVEAAGGDNPSP